jgi:peptidoglycan/LPS O-acetylase OafA/YrhL
MQRSDIGQQATTAHGPFLPGIEGMRALAVGVVLLFHLDISFFGGGYLGVDLFFVISGFIISRNILSDIALGKFTLKDFYIRRFRRLLPALLVTVLLTLIAGLFLLPPAELANTAESAIYAVFSLANFHFWLGSGYFDAAADAKPLLHTWSLSVEEQFYLFWPALLLVLATTRRRVTIILLLLLFSLASALLWRDVIADAIFYLLPFRLHQLMAGALVAVLSLRVSKDLGNLTTLLATAGFICVAVFVSGSYSPAVGAAAVTALGCLLLLGAETRLALTLYGNRPMQWIGQRSYAIYLVHWPIIVLFKFGTDFVLSATERALLLSLTLIAAALLHKYVEEPFRQRRTQIKLPDRVAIPAAISIFAFTVTIAALLWHLDGLPSRSDARVQNIVDSVDREKGLRERSIRFGKCNLQKVHDFSDYDAAECAAIDPDRKNVLVIGDSVAADTYMMLSQNYPEIHFLQSTAGACTALLEINDTRGRYPACLALNDYRFSELAKLDIDLIVLASLWTEERIGLLKDTVEHLHSLDRNILILGPRISFTGSVPLLISNQGSLEGINVKLQEHVVGRRDLLAKMRAAVTDVEIVDIGAIQCSPQCDVVEGDHLLYFDAFHFTKLGAKRVGERFRATFDFLGYIKDANSEVDAL